MTVWVSFSQEDNAKWLSWKNRAISHHGEPLLLTDDTAWGILIFQVMGTGREVMYHLHNSAGEQRDLQHRHRLTVALKPGQWTDAMVGWGEEKHLLCKCEAWSSNPQNHHES